MLSFNLIIKVVIAASLLYFVLNAFFRYHLQIEITQAGLILAILMVLIIYSDLAYTNVFSITIGILIITYIIIRIIFFRKKVGYYFLLSFSSRQAKKLVDMSNDLNISYKTYNKVPCLIKFFDYDSSSLRRLFKLFEKFLKDYKLKLSLRHYWVVIIYLVIVTILWRF